MWVKLPLQLGHLLPILAKKGYTFHNAEGTTAMLLKWVAPKQPCSVPPFATHQVGVGGLVFNSSGLMLAVKDHHGLPLLKLPGGLANLGEDFGATAVREVQEETGVVSEFESLLAMRHQHNVAWGRSDIYVVCALRALTETICMDPGEISECRWVSREEFIANAHASSIASRLLRNWPIAGLSEQTLPTIANPDRTFKLYANLSASSSSSNTKQ